MKKANAVSMLKCSDVSTDLFQKDNQENSEWKNNDSEGKVSDGWHKLRKRRGFQGRKKKSGHHQIISDGRNLETN